MSVLVAVASKHGSTKGIGEAIAAHLRTMGLDAEIHDVDDVTNPREYDAVVLGSAVYMGRWMSEARQFAEVHWSTLAGMPVWLFSSGPIGADEPQPTGESEDALRLLEQIGARGHRTFAGRLEPAELGLGERLAVKVVRAPAGDFRDWEAIRTWAREIGESLSPAAQSSTDSYGLMRR